MIRFKVKRVASFLLLIALGLAIVSFLAIRYKKYYNSQSIEVRISQAKIPKTVYKMAAKEAKEFKKRGYLLVEEGTIIDNKKIEKILPSVPFNKLVRNTTFSVVKPTWLPKRAKLVGSFPGGPTVGGPWEIISLAYKSSEGEFRLGEAQPRDTRNVSYAYPKSLVNDEINGAKAIKMAYVERNTGRRWNSIAWHHNGIDFFLQGELSLETLKRIAKSIS